MATRVCGKQSSKTNAIIVPVLTAIGLVAGHWLQSEEADAQRHADAEAHLEVTRYLEAAVQVAEEEGRRTRQRLEEEAATARQEEAAARQDRRRIEAAATEVVALMRESDPSLTIEEALDLVAEELRETRDQISGIRMYGDVAELNALGKHKWVESEAGGLAWNTPLTQAMEGTWIKREHDGTYRMRCGPDSLTKLSAAAENFPTFPFAHYALAICAARAGDVRWRQHAGRAMEILRHTTQIAGRHMHHAETYDTLRMMTDAIGQQRRTSIGAILSVPAGRAEAVR